ncbi:exonuclease domain-containing protein [Corynebacterium ureicelerivorans]|uniref:exonuclease domain-containing protein n=1 Tax=Corynebacterium ureicelerivorans TaxID=401472 RepID=UPI002650CD7D|nr:exonuclease domain-containing protein [Corynebacterium ureicelerivorans]MDN8605454.1 exonuclease domain-containing protein [Corynebacterium ureicelerivorans]
MTENDYPYVALFTQATGIHPSTGRLLTVDAVTFDAAGRVGEEFHAVLNPGTDPGPAHTHGLTPHDFAQAPRFSRYLRTLDKLIDGRVLVTHDSPVTWGFVVSEARRAMNAAARANRSRRGRGNKRRQRVGHVPKPEAIVDLLASARRQGHVPADTRINAVANLVGVASPERIGEAEADFSREQTLKLVAMYLQLATGGVSRVDPADLAPDQFGLQRSALRVDAEKAPAIAANPGLLGKGGLLRGMEFVVSDDIALDPDELIDAGVRAGLTYREKLTRETSVAVSDAVERGAQLRGKAMHAHRKNIPVVSGEEFARLVGRMGPAE